MRRLCCVVLADPLLVTTDSRTLPLRWTSTAQPFHLRTSGGAAAGTLFCIPIPAAVEERKLGGGLLHYFLGPRRRDTIYERW